MVFLTKKSGFLMVFVEFFPKKQSFSGVFPKTKKVFLVLFQKKGRFFFWKKDGKNMFFFFPFCLAVFQESSGLFGGFVHFFSNILFCLVCRRGPL